MDTAPLDLAAPDARPAAVAVAVASAAAPAAPAAEDAFERALAAHDRAVAATGLRCWLGGEPTFTDRGSQDPCWLGLALGGDKEERARALVAALAARTRGGFVIRSIGRQYPGEPHARWSYGLYARRDGEAWWEGPPDPLLRRAGADAGSEAEQAVDGAPGRAGARARGSTRADLAPDHGLAPSARAPTTTDLDLDVDAASARALRDRLADRLAERLARGPTAVARFDGPDDARLVYRAPVGAFDGAPACALGAPGSGLAAHAPAPAPAPPLPDPSAEPRLLRASIHARPIPESGLVDDLAAEGLLLVVARPCAREPGVLAVEVPALPDPLAFRALLADLSAAARALDLAALVLEGFGPPIDPGALFPTVTPDPAVVEINMAPAEDTRGFLAALRDIHAAASAAELSSVRYFWNGEVGDSGGGGHLTLGGPAPEESPFVVHPCLAPALVAYLSRHPALSYLFAVASIGSSSQAPRADEGPREARAELDLALRRLARRADRSPETTWRALQPFLCDRSGNTHRAEVNVEKLWNPRWPGRGCMGVVELRALRMAETPEEASALAALFRAVVARLAAHAPAESALGLADWGAELHDRFALPFFLARDLDEVLADLAASGLGLEAPLQGPLRLALARRLLGSARLGPLEVTLRRGLEFWPLVGDVASQERGAARLVDASTVRVEVVIRPAAGAPASVLAGARASVLAPLAPSLEASPSARSRSTLRAAGEPCDAGEPCGTSEARGAREPRKVAEPGEVGEGARPREVGELAEGSEPDASSPIRPIALPLAPAFDQRGPALVFGVRYRAFVPLTGLHPGLGALDPLSLRVTLEGHPEALTLSLYGWEPTGAAYPHLPRDASEAASRRSARFVAALAPAPPTVPLAPPPDALTPFSLDLRRLAP